MSRDKQNIKTTDWLTRGMTEAEIAKVKEEAIAEADAERRDKQIEEMYNDLFECISYDEWSAKEYGNEAVDIYTTSEKLVAKGYRKASEVAREIFEDLQGLLVMRIGVNQAIAELKMKYTEKQ